ncbi:MAG: hypothetical protein ACI4O9_02455 [Akkermansia sp.]
MSEQSEKNLHCLQEDELAKYAESVRAYIRNESDTVFQNNSPKHASIIIGEFLLAAKETAYIFCGKLSSTVYDPLKVLFMMAKGRGVDIKVITASDYNHLESSDLKEYLMTNEMLRCAPRLQEYPHFLIIDGKRFRLEVDQKEKKAIVCASATAGGAGKIAERLNGSFSTLWGLAQ